MSHYAAGTRFEHKTIADLEGNGYEIIRAAGSKGRTKVDIAAMKPGQLLFVQCKRSGALPPAEWDRVYEVAGWVGAIPLLAANGPRGRGVTYTRLLGPKIPRARTQPCEPFLLDQIAQAPTVVDLAAAVDRRLAVVAEHHLPLLDLSAAEVVALVRAADQYTDEWAVDADRTGLPADQPDPQLLTALDKLAVHADPRPLVAPYRPAGAIDATTVHLPA